MLRIYNSLSKQKEDFVPRVPGKVGIYVCGMTVYDLCHIGHGRLFVVFDMVTRYLRYAGFDVTYVRNITDIDDKIINRAIENNEAIDQLTGRNIKAMYEDEAALGVLRPDLEPRATQHIPGIINMIKTLIKAGYAYLAANGDVYYAVKNFPTYGELAQQDINKLRAGARVDVLDVKRDPLDFVLWKLAKPQEPSWDSPWGKGRPGWHIECSAMSTETLGKHFDLHGGGMDLLFPHHQNEIAQSEGANGCKMVNIWMHNGFVQVDQEKMSKSLGNFFTIREVLKLYDPEVVRYFMLASHYRSPISYSTENLASAELALQRFYLCLRDLPEATEPADNDYEARFVAAMNDDFNTPVAMAVLFDMAREVNRLKKQGKGQASAAGLATQVKRLGGVLGLLQRDALSFLQVGVAAEQREIIEELIAERRQARVNKEWARADQLRDQLHQMGIEVEDRTDQTIWHRKIDMEIEEAT
jgi:cysteinyl-tRNA synthetase